jgi:hypothetical protein
VPTTAAASQLKGRKVWKRKQTAPADEPAQKENIKDAAAAHGAKRQDIKQMVAVPSQRGKRKNYATTQLDEPEESGTPKRKHCLDLI